MLLHLDENSVIVNMKTLIRYILVGYIVVVFVVLFSDGVTDSLKKHQYNC